MPVFALAAGAVLATAVAETTESKSASAPGAARRQHSPVDSHAHRRPGADHDNYRKANPRFREMAQEEIEQLPALHARLTEIADIQTRRATLQKQRKAAADTGTDSRGKVIGRFHTLLQKDLELAERVRQIAQEIVKDTPAIKEQLQLRRQRLNEPPVDDAATSVSAAAESSAHKREIRMRLRYLDFLERKLDDIAAHPERVDLLVRMMKGTPRDVDAASDSPAATAFRPRSDVATTGSLRTATTDQLRRRRRELQREMREIDLLLQKQKK